MKYLLRLLIIFSILTLAFGKTDAQWTLDTISFETSSSKIVIAEAGNSLWQIGEPQKTFFDSAHSGIKAIMTDTLNSYPENDTSSFIYAIRDPYTQTCLTCMEFWHKYDMDSLTDQGLIDASYDGGDSWVSVKDTFVNGNGFLWNPDFHKSNGKYTNHLLITSGKSDGWIKSSFCWQWFIPVNPDSIIINPDSLLVRFTFISDSIAKNKEGWMIDDIVTSSAGWELCSSTKESYLYEIVTIYPNPFSSQAIMQKENDFKNATLNIFNSLGQPVKQIINITGPSIVLSRDNLPEGLYFLQLTEGYGILKTIKIVITDH